MTQVTFPAAVLQTFCASIFAAAGVSEAEAGCIAFHLVRANLTGHDSHGVVRTPRYVQMLETGLVFAGREVRTVSETPALLHLDGRGGFGQAIGEQAVDRGCALAKASGAAVVALGNSGHLGRIGDWAERAAEQGLASIHMVAVRGRSLVAPFGGIDRRMSTSPLCLGVPTEDAPVIHDFATSTVAEGKALVAAQGGKALPDGALVSGDGVLTADPYQLYGETITTAVPDAAKGPGALTAFGAHKGSGLSILIELLAGGLSGTGANKTFLDAEEAPFRNSMLAVYIDPDRVAGRDFLRTQVVAYGDYVRSARPAQGHDAVLMPGDKERQVEAERLSGGLPLSAAFWDRMIELGGRLGVPVPEVRG